MEFNRLLEVAAERELCSLCTDGSDDTCFFCEKAKGIPYAELIEYFAAVNAALRRTAEIDTAREEGRLVVLPCKVGDTAYDTYVETLTGEKVVSDTRTFGALRIELLHAGVVDEIVPLSDIGKTVFLSRAEAEAALGGGGDASCAL